jgi:hypothetical protein
MDQSGAAEIGGRTQGESDLSFAPSGTLERRVQPEQKGTQFRELECSPFDFDSHCRGNVFGCDIAVDETTRQEVDVVGVSVGRVWEEGVGRHGKFPR